MLVQLEIAAERAESRIRHGIVVVPAFGVLAASPVIPSEEKCVFIPGDGPGSPGYAAGASPAEG